MSSDSRKRASAPAAAEAGDERARATGESALTAAADETNLGDAGSLAAFEKWCVDRGFVLHAALELRDVTPRGSTRVSNAVFASADVCVGDVLVEIPKAWCLTPRTGSVSLAVPEDDLEDLDEAALILAVMYERAKGEASAWWPYFRRLPADHEPIPTLWSEEDKKHLAGTDVAARLKSDAAALRADHARIMDVCRKRADRLVAFFPDGNLAPLSEVSRARARDDDDAKDAETDAEMDAESDGDAVSDGGILFPDASSDDSDAEAPPPPEVEDGPFGFRAFLAAASLVASRAFHVDDATGQGLVPVADLFNHAGGGKEHAHFEGGEADDARESLESLDSESDDARVEAEMTRLERDDPTGATAFEAFEALEREGRTKPVSIPATYGDRDEDVSNPNAEFSGAASAATETSARGAESDTLRLVAVAAARRGDELFNTFGDHGNALLLHKYGFVEWTNAASGSGGVAISAKQLRDLLGSSEAYYRAFAALEGLGGFAESSDDEEHERHDEADERNDERNEADEASAAPWESAADADAAGAAAARAAGWSGGKYELSKSGELSRDLLLVLAVALADGDEDDAFFRNTGLPPGLETRDDAALLRQPGVAEAALAVIKTRLAALPRGSVDGDLEKARELARRVRGNDASGAAPNGVAGVPAALVLRADERATCEKALARLVARLRRDASDDAEVDAEDEPPNDSRLSDVVPLQDTPYGAVVYLPKRDSFAGKRERKP